MHYPMLKCKVQYFMNLCFFYSFHHTGMTKKSVLSIKSKALSPIILFTASGSNPGSNAPTPSRVTPAHSPAHTPHQNTTPTGTPTTQQKQQHSSSTPPTNSSTADTVSLGSTDGQTADGQPAGSLTQRFSKWFSGGEGKVKQGMRDETNNEPGKRWGLGQYHINIPVLHA